MIARSCAAAFVLVAALLVASGDAHAIPRFAVRTGLPCGACHVNPTGGGMRSPFGAGVFAAQWLAMRVGGESRLTPPGLEIGEHVRLGGDLRAAYMFLRSTRPEFQDTSSFMLMQADVYLHIDAGRLEAYVDKGAYGGFEAYALVHALAPGRKDLTLKVGRFYPPFGVRDVNHAAWVREGVGLGAVDRDTGVELGYSVGRTSAFLSIMNGTYGEAIFDTGGSTEFRPYDKALSARLSMQPRLGPFRLLLVLSGMLNLNVGQANPLFVPALFVGSQGETVREGVDELRVGGVLGVSLGRLSYRGEVVAVRDWFNGDLRSMTGYASYQELAVVPVQGLEIVCAYEFADSDLDFARGRVDRIGFGLEWFPMPYLEVSALARHTFGDADFVIGARDELVLFVHAFL